MSWQAEPLTLPGHSRPPKSLLRVYLQPNTPNHNIPEAYKTLGLNPIKARVVPRSWVNGVAWAPDGQRIITGGGKLEAVPALFERFV